MSSLYNHFGGLFPTESYSYDENARESLSELSVEDFPIENETKQIHELGEIKQSQQEDSAYQNMIMNFEMLDFQQAANNQRTSPTNAAARKLDYFAEFEQSLHDEDNRDRLIQEQQQKQDLAYQIKMQQLYHQQLMKQNQGSKSTPKVHQMQQLQIPLQGSHVYGGPRQGQPAFPLVGQSQTGRMNGGKVQQFQPTNSRVKGNAARPRMQAIPNWQSIIYQVQFKLEFRYFLCHPHYVSDADIHIDAFVIVEGEKGEDLGVVVNTMTLPQYTDMKNGERHLPQFQDEDRTIRFILRVANNWLDCTQLPQKYHDEKIVVDHAKEVVRHALNLPMQVVAAEYQFDRTKLFVYYTANTRVDFRELISKLYAIFKTCIWLKKLHPNQVFDARRHAAIAMRTGVMPEADEYEPHQPPSLASPSSYMQSHHQPLHIQKYQQNVSDVGEYETHIPSPRAYMQQQKQQPLHSQPHYQHVSQQKYQQNIPSQHSYSQPQFNNYQQHAQQRQQSFYTDY